MHLPKDATKIFSEVCKTCDLHVLFLTEYVNTISFRNFAKNDNENLFYVFLTPHSHVNIAAGFYFSIDVVLKYLQTFLFLSVLKPVQIFMSQDATMI